MKWLWTFSFVVQLSTAIAKNDQQPNIVFIVADDLGWDDVSFHGSDQILTPNIDSLAYQGVILNQYYSDTTGSASRSALFTGKYPMRMGMQGISIEPSEDRGIPITETLLPEYLRELGYKTHLGSVQVLRKWGVGKSRAQYLPTNRGFNTFYGFTGDSVDYLTYNTVEEYNETLMYGLDFFENLDVVVNLNGHLTHIISDRAVNIIREHNTSRPLYLHVSHAAPHVGGGLVTLQPTLNSVKENDHIIHSARRLYAGLVTSLDNSVGNIVAALAERNILHNTIMIFVSDNGAPTIEPTKNFGSNYPFRGTKGTPWEGGVRSVALVWHYEIVPRIHDSIFHVTDWVPTLTTAARGNINIEVDGINQWLVLIDNETPTRNDVLITVDDLNGWAAFRESDFKMVIGDVTKERSGFYGKELRQSKPRKKSQLIYDDILLDCETSRVSKEILQMNLDVDVAYNIRSELNMTRLNRTNVTIGLCLPTKAKGCLYNISADPMETNDLWNTLPDVVRRMSLRLRALWTELKARRPPTSDPKADPSLRNYVWSHWVSDEESNLEPTLPMFPLQVSFGEMQYLVDLNFNLLRDQLNLYIGNVKQAITQSVGKLFNY